MRNPAHSDECCCNDCYAADFVANSGGAVAPSPSKSEIYVTRRDRFAMAALAGIMAHPNELQGNRTPVELKAEIAKLCYQYADAMEKARQA